MAVFIRSFYIYSFHAWSVCLFELTSSHFRIQGPEIVVSKSSSFLWNTKITRLITYAQYIYNDAHVNMYSHVHVLLSAKTKVERRKFQRYVSLTSTMEPSEFFLILRRSTALNILQSIFMSGSFEDRRMTSFFRPCMPLGRPVFLNRKSTLHRIPLE